MRTTQRNRTTIGDRMKLHLRVRTFRGTELRIIAPRPGTDLQFATNRYHDTWHVLSDLRGARFLAHLLWGLSYQQRPGTVALIDTPFLRTNPFDADPSDPILIVPRHLTPIRARVVAALAASRGSLGMPDGTVRLHSWGLKDPRPDQIRDGRETFGREHGVLVLRANRIELRELAWAFDRMGRHGLYFGSDYEYFADWPWSSRRVDGELQVFDDFRERVREAARARRQLGFPQRPGVSDAMAPTIWRASRALQDRRERRGYGRD